MKNENSILVAFILNLGFSIFEFFGGIITGSVAILSDSVHDIGDAAGIGLSYFLEKKSKKRPDEEYTYGYGRYSVVGGLITTVILLMGSAAVIVNAVQRLISPTPINYDGMIIFAVVGVIINSAAAYFTGHGDSVNTKAAHLHMFEDVLGWAVVLVGAVIMRFTDLSVIDPVMSIGVALFILVNAAKNLKEVFDVFLEKIPDGISIDEIEKSICTIDGVAGVHHIHVWSMEGVSHYATMHIVTSEDSHEIKEAVRKNMKELGVSHVTIEIEKDGEHCGEQECMNEPSTVEHHHHHHHHH